MSKTVLVPVDAEFLRHQLRLPGNVFIRDAEGVVDPDGRVRIVLTLWSEEFEDAEEPPELMPVITRIPERIVWDFAGVKLA